MVRHAFFMGCFFVAVLCGMRAQADVNRAHVRTVGSPKAVVDIYGKTGWTDEGLNTLVSDPDYRDPVSGARGLHRFLMSNPCQQRRQKGAASSCARLRVLVLFVDFSDRRVVDAEDQFQQFQTYLDFLAPAAQWLKQSSYGQLQLQFVSPQNDRKLDWIRLSRPASEYVVNRDDHLRFAYVREIAQMAYDRYQIRVDDYDTLLIMPVKGEAGLPNGPATISAHYVGEQRLPSELAYRDKQGRAHAVDHFITAGNDLFRWGPLWFVHELGHLLGLPDTYLYDSKIRGQDVHRFFYVGAWDMMGNIGGHSPDFFAWHKLKLKWLSQQQVVTLALPVHDATHQLSPIEFAGGVKLIVIPTGLQTAYVAELRSGVGANAKSIAGHGDDAVSARRGVLIYKIDASSWLSTDIPVAQVISRGYFYTDAVGGAANKTGLWRAIDRSEDPYLGGALWQANDVFEDEETGVRIHIENVAFDARELAQSSARLNVSVRKNLLTQVKPGLDILAACVKDAHHVQIRFNRAPMLFVATVGDGTEGPKRTSQEVPLSRLVAQEFVLERGKRRLDSQREIQEMKMKGEVVSLQLRSPLRRETPLRISTQETQYFSAASAKLVGACN